VISIILNLSLFVKSMIVWSCAKTLGEKLIVNTLKISIVSVHSSTKLATTYGLVMMLKNKSDN